ncbi:VOC family protein [Gemmata sp. G18]|uniref:VOC family protein n=1 Tax=Gemmata palustris TaxID=2822762 RepID=A0ABS5BUI0_9BACT|nr:VOC family protein [Gemmata palustris]MBP3957361.1 VOC family protein [Gemmata palustris]
MNLNHLNLTVTDVPETYRFLETYFGMRGTSANNNIAFLTDANGMILTLTSMKLGGVDEVKYPPNFHIGFGQPNADAVSRASNTDRGRST